MGSKVSTLTVSLKDDVSGKADKIGRALNKATDQARAMARAMEGSGASKGFTSSLTRLGLSARDIEKVSASLRDYAKAAGLSAKAADWTKAQTAQIRQWETATIASLRHVTAEQRAQAAAQLEAAVKAGQAQAAARKAAETDTTRTLERMARDKVAAERSAARDAAAIARTAARDARSERLASAREERTEAARTARQKMQWAVEAGRQARRDREQGEAEVQRRAEAQLQSRTDARRAIVGGVGLYTAHKVKEGTHATLETYRDFDKYKRQTQAFGNFSDPEMAKIVDQAIHGGATSRFNDIQWLQGAKALGGRGVKAAPTMGILGEAAQYGQAMSTDLPEAVAGLEGSLFAFKRNLSTPEMATAAARRTADLQVGAAKAFGLTHHDLKGGYEYGALCAEMSGLGEEKLLAFLGLGKKLNIDGMTQGNAFNAMTAKFLSPTRKGREALAGVGVDYSQFQKMPDRLSVDNFSNMVAQQYGVKLDKGARGKLDTAFSNKDVFTNSSAFAVAVKDALKGQVGISGAKDANKVVGSAERFRQNNVEKVDVNGLLDALMAKMADGNLALANAIFGEKQGKRVMAALRDGDVWRESVKKVQDTPEGKAKDVADKINAGFDGAVARFEGAIKNLETAVGNSLDNNGQGGFLTKLANSAAVATQALAKIPQPLLAAGGALAWLGGKASGAAGTAALIGAAFSLNASAGALTAAAASLGGAGTLGRVAAGAGLTSLAIGTLAVGSIAVAGAITTALLIDGAESGKAIVHGGKPDAGQAMNPSDELPGLEGSNEKPTWAKPRFTMPKPLAPNSPAPDVVGKPNLDRKTAPLPPRRPERFGKGAVPEVTLPEQAVIAPTAPIAPAPAPKGDEGYFDRMHARANEYRAELEKLGGVNVQPTIATGSLDAVGQKADEATTKLTALGGITVAPKGDASGLRSITEEANAAAAALQRVISLSAQARSGIGEVNAAAGAIRARSGSASFSDGVTPGAGGP